MAVDENKKKKEIAEWRYDQYHLVQTRYYEVLDRRQLAEDEEGGSGATGSLQAPYISRPADLPDIPTAVQGLPLTDFQKTAQERAIGIVSTWIFDAGLIDELLLNTGIAEPTGVGAAAEEGVEVGAHGHPLEGTQKTDKEIDKLRESTKRELALINNRLEDGVAASGSEVQELVNAVMTTKNDLARLRELTTYISNGGDLEAQHQFLLTNFPKLKTAINARRNLSKCFRELDFFSQIPATCDRLRDELNSCEWTDHEWFTLRDVCREHVELQLFLVEAETGMKSRMADNDDDEEDEVMSSSMSYNAQRDSRQGYSSNHDQVDRFLQEHVKNVWELGKEISTRVLAGIGAAFDLAQQNPAGMVALVEAVEVYESAADEYRQVHRSNPIALKSNDRGKNRITDMRRSALLQIAEDFEARSTEVFHSMVQKAADDAGSGDAEIAKFNSILRAANNLTYQMELVKTKLSPCFPSFWNVETLWMTCVAAVCSQHILEHIGEDGYNLPSMTVTELLDLMAWIDSFRSKVEERFPDIAHLTGSKAAFASVKELMKGKDVDMKSAKENLAWVAQVLFGVHRTAEMQFSDRTQDQTTDWLDNVYQYVSCRRP